MSPQARIDYAPRSEKIMKSDSIAFLAVVAATSIAGYFMLSEKEITSELVGSVFRIIVTIYFMYFVRDIAVSLQAIAKRRK